MAPLKFITSPDAARPDGDFGTMHLDVGTAVLLMVASTNGQVRRRHGVDDDGEKRTHDTRRATRRCGCGSMGVETRTDFWGQTRSSRPLAFARHDAHLTRSLRSSLVSCADASQVEAAKCRAVCKDWQAYTDAWLRTVGPSLNLSGASREDDAYLVTSTLRATAAGCPKVWHLSVRECSGVTPDALAAVANGCPALTHLDLAHSDVSDAALVAFVNAGSMHRVRELDITGCHNLTHSTLSAVVAACTNLTTLIATELDAVNAAMITDLVAVAKDLVEVRVDLSAVSRDAMVKAAGGVRGLYGGKYAVQVCSFDGDQDAAPMCCLVLADDVDGACM